MGALASGDHSMEIPAIDKRDEIGLMARAVVVFKENISGQRSLRPRKPRRSSSAWRVRPASTN
jgi:methyl-accepting chemotaxis protein